MRGESLNQSPEHLAMRERIRQEAEERTRKRQGQRDAKYRAPKTNTKIIEFALRTHGGNITDAAHFLGVNVTFLRKRVENSAKLREVLEEVTSELLDFAENVVAQSVFNGNLSAAMWLLKMKGKERGYIEKSINELELGEKSMRSADELIKAMREGRRELEVLDGGEVTWVEPKQITENHDQTK